MCKEVNNVCGSCSGAVAAISGCLRCQMPTHKSQIQFIFYISQLFIHKHIYTHNTVLSNTYICMCVQLSFELSFLYFIYIFFFNISRSLFFFIYFPLLRQDYFSQLCMSVHICTPISLQVLVCVCVRTPACLRICIVARFQIISLSSRKYEQFFCMNECQRNRKTL